jgi:hypothetical protein
LAVPHLELVYEDNLLRPEVHLATVNLVRAFLGMRDASSVSSSYSKITDRSLKDEVVNHDEILEALRKEGMEDLIW